MKTSYRRVGPHVLAIGPSLDLASSRGFRRFRSRLAKEDVRECVIDVSRTRVAASAGFGGFVRMLLELSDAGISVTVFTTLHIRRLIELADLALYVDRIVVDRSPDM